MKIYTLEFREMFKNKNIKIYAIYKDNKQVFKTENKNLFEIAKKQFLEEFKNVK